MQLEMPTLQIRGARAADAMRVANCYLASRKLLLPYAPLAHNEGEVHVWVRDTLLPAGGVTVAIESGHVVGFVAVSDRDGARWIDQLYVHPTRLRRGIGSTLLHLALQRLAPPIRLWTYEPNRGARRFYERHGFVAVAFGDGSGNESHCPDVLYERSTPPDKG